MALTIEMIRDGGDLTVALGGRLNGASVHLPERSAAAAERRRCAASARPSASASRTR